jgi:quercetin dioxygenase-like cupin family protein
MDIGSVRRPRRIVTGLRDDGSSYLARVDEVEEIDYAITLPGGPHGESSSTVNDPDTDADRGGFFRIWGTDRLPIPLPTDGRAPYFDTEPSGEETPEALRRATTLPPPLGVRIGWSRHLTQGPPGPFHYTDTTDMLFVMAGQRGEILDRAEAVLRAGDVLIQNGTTHAHESITAEPTVLGYVVVGALRVGEHPPRELLHSISGPAGGYRPGETREKEPPPAWSVPAAAPGSYDGADRTPLATRDVVRPRRAVTGSGEDGKSHFVAVEELEDVESGAPGHETWRAWTIDRLPDLLPTAGVEASRALHPEPLGVVTTIRRIAPTDAPSAMGWQDTMDVVFVMSGSVVLQLDGGEEIELRPGDVLIENGTNHAWHNRGDEPALLGTASFAGVRDGTTPPLADRRPVR